jgi:large subunit ribosomal protein L33
LYNQGLATPHRGCGTQESRVFSGKPAMAKSKKKVETVFLVCDETGDYNYTLRRKSGGEKLKLKKYSARLRKHTLHTEKKK